MGEGVNNPKNYKVFWYYQREANNIMVLLITKLSKIFFLDLSYWRINLIYYNVDVMQIKNFFDNIFNINIKKLREWNWKSYAQVGQSIKMQDAYASNIIVHWYKIK